MIPLLLRLAADAVHEGMQPKDAISRAWYRGALVDLWESFTDGTGYTKDEAVLGLLLLADICEDAE